jgi:hypothetical protein
VSGGQHDGWGIPVKEARRKAAFQGSSLAEGKRGPTFLAYFHISVFHRFFMFCDGLSDW